MSPREKILFYTDGLTEAVNIVSKTNMVRPEDFETGPLKDILMENSGTQPGIFIQEIVKALINFRGCEDFEDDVCIICLQV